MMAPDPTAVRRREAAERRRRIASGELSPLVYGSVFSEVIDQRERNDANRLADAYLAEHGPALLTVERLVEMGFERVNRTDNKWQRGDVRAYPDSQIWTWYHMPDSGVATQIFPVPRTVGELRQLLARMET